MNRQKEGSLKGLFKIGESTYVPSQSHNCVARDFYATGRSIRLGIPITSIHNTFHNAFLAGEGRVDDCSLGTMLHILDFEKPGTLDPVFQFMGMPSDLSTLLGHVSFLVQRYRADGSSKSLKGNFKRNIFIVRDQYEKHKTITFHWDGWGWTIACVDNVATHRFNAGDRFFYATKYIPSPRAA